jgi:ATP-dependent Clp protease adaptor protein ClpS
MLAFRNFRLSDETISVMNNPKAPTAARHTKPTLRFAHTRCQVRSSGVSTADPLAEPDVVTTTIPEVTYVVVDDAELEKPFRVIIENDDVTPMEFVVMVLVFVFELTYDRSVEVMLEAHNNGRAHVVTLPFEEAQRRVYAAQSSAREAGYPLSFYLEPE